MSDRVGGRKPCGTREPELAPIVDDALPLETGERSQPVFLRIAVTDDVPDVDPAGDERVRDELAVAAPGDRLGAHHGRGSRPRELDQLVQLAAELRRLHVIGVRPEARALPGYVRRVPASTPTTAESRQPSIRDPDLRERGGERLALEVRMAPGGRIATHVGHVPNPVGREQPEEIGDGQDRVPDGVDDHR